MTLVEATLQVSVFCALAGLFVLVPGACVTVLLGSTCKDLAERLFLAAVTGFIVASTFTLWVAPIDPRLVWLLPVLAAGFLFWRRGSAASLLADEPRSGGLWLLAAIGLVVVGLAPRLDYLDPVEGGFALTTFYDQFLHTGAIGELLRGVPIEQMPHLSGETFWRYHPFTNLFAYLFVVTGGLDAVFTHLVLLPGFAWVVIALGIAVVVRSWTGNLATGLIAVAVYFCPIYTQAEGLLIQRNPPSLLAMLPVLGAAWAVTRDTQARSRGAFVLASICVAALFPTKANIFLAVFPAFAIYALDALRRRRASDVGIGAMAGAVILAVPALLHLTHTLPRGIGIDYGRFAGFLVSQLQLGLDASGLLGPVVVVLVWFWMLGGVHWIGTIVGVAFAWRSRRSAPAILAAGALFFSCILVCLFPTEKGAGQYEAWNAAWFTRNVVVLLVVMSGVAGFGAAAGVLLRRRSELVRYGLPLALVLQLGSTSIALARGNPEEPLFVPRGWMNAMRELRDGTAPEAVVATEQNLWGGTVTSGFSLRRVFAERVVLMSTYYDSVPSRLADIDLIWESEDPQAVRAVLGARGITHLVEYADRPIRAAEAAGLRSLFDEDGIRILLYPGSKGSEAAPGATLQARVEAERRYRAVLEVLRGLDPDAVAKRERVSRATLESWIRRARSRNSILDTGWPVRTPSPATATAEAASAAGRS